MIFVHFNHRVRFLMSLRDPSSLYTMLAVCMYKYINHQRISKKQLCFYYFCIAYNQAKKCESRVSSVTTDMVRGKQGYTRGTHIWEITWKKEHRGSHAVIGVASYSAPLQGLGECSQNTTPLDATGRRWDFKIKKILYWHTTGSTHMDIRQVVHIWTYDR